MYRKLFVMALFVWLTPMVWADNLTLDLGTTAGSMMARMIQLFLTLTVLSIAPALIMMVTSFTRIVVVFSFVRNALGTQQAPPNMIMLCLSLFLTLFIMGPAFETAYNDALYPLIEDKITEKEAFEKAIKPFQQFMLHNVREKDLQLFATIGGVDTIATADETPLKILIPAFVISELRRAFEIGFLVFLPFLVIDIVVASILMSMGMMMLPPVMISMPFKLIFFVLIDGWHLLCGTLVKSFKL